MINNRMPHSTLVAFCTVTALGICGCSAEPEQSASGSAVVVDDVAVVLGEEELDASDTSASTAGSEEFALIWAPSELAARFADDGLRILDARSKQAYDESHVRGAVHVAVADWKSQASADGGLHDVAAWSDRLGAVGIDNSTRVIVYGDSMPSTARVWWTLKYVGVAHAAVLDGGWQAWLESGGETSSESSAIEPAQFTPEFQPQRLAEIGDLKESYQAADVALVDTRSDGEFSGGHIPGAVRVEWSDLLNEDGRFKPADELRQMFAASGIDENSTAITYCRSGGRASVDALALELAGFKNVKNYYCSWQQWSADPDAPVAQPEQAVTGPDSEQPPTP